MKHYWPFIPGFDQLSGLVVLLIIGALFRWWGLGAVPAGMSPDEAAISYDAWAITLSGNDHWGKPWPVSFTSFGDYKAPGLIYLLAGWFWLFGMNEGALRGVVAVFGTLLILITYGLAREWWPRKPGLALTAAGLVAVSPWHIHLSRSGFEAVVAITLVALATWAYCRGSQKPRFQIFAGLLFGAAFYFYHSPKIILVPLMFWLWFSEVRLNRLTRWPWRMWLIFGLCLIPFGLDYDQSMVRASQTLITQPQQWLIQVIRHLDWRWWFLGGYNLHHAVAYFGILSLPEGWLVATAAFYGWRLKSKALSSILIICGLMLVPSILSQEAPHTLRSVLLLPWLQLVAAWGAYIWWQNRRKWLPWGILILGGYSLGFWLVYTTSYTYMSAPIYQTGLKEAMLAAQALGRTKEEIVISSSIEQPYIYYLLFTRIKPQDFLAGATANVTFRPVRYPFLNANTVYLTTTKEVPHDAPEIVEKIIIPGSDEPAWLVAITGE
jgi:4-amino-4-deoxy-L-arabinose transferase-like glycosyltransferase